MDVCGMIKKMRYGKVTIMGTNNKVTQIQAVVNVMKLKGGYSTLADLYKDVPQVENVTWNTQNVNANIRRIVQNEKLFYKLNRGIWALNECKDALEKIYIIGETISLIQGDYIVQNVYQLTDEYMKENEMYCKNRVTLVSVLDSNDIIDFAISENK